MSADSTSESRRIIGYDVARALAIWGMIVVHFTIVGAAPSAARPAWVYQFVHEYLDGRAAATFMVLAGIGLTLFSRRAVASANPHEIERVQKTIVRRGLFLLIAGFLNLIIWPGDILRIYGVTLFFAAYLVTATNRKVLTVAGAFVLGFFILFAMLDYETHWDWETMTYSGLWSPGGAVRNLFYDGFRSVFPWSAFVLFGMWLGRFDWNGSIRRWRLLGISLLVAAVAELASHLVVSTLREGGWNSEDADYLFGTISMPPLPLFLLSAGGTATAVIALCLLVSENGFFRNCLAPFASAGRMALTWYVLHIVVGLGTLDALGLTETMSLSTAAGVGCAFYGGVLVISEVWMRTRRVGPIEELMRSLTNPRAERPR